MEAQLPNSNSVSCVIINEDDPDGSRTPEPAIKLRLTQTSEEQNKKDKKVKFQEDTVDNENLNRKKSKCCCIYTKPKKFGESSSEDENDDDCCPNNCHGPKEYHKNAYRKNPAPKPDDNQSNSSEPV